MEKTVAITGDTWKALKQLQLDLNCATMDEVINILLVIRKTAQERAAAQVKAR